MASKRIPLLARLRVGTKLMLLVLLPVCVLLGFTGLNALADWRFIDALHSFRTETRLSLATAGLADQVAAERAAAVLLRLRPGTQASAGLGSSQRQVDQALREAERGVAGWHGTVDVAGRLEAARRQLAALRSRVATGSLPLGQIPGAYDTIVASLISTAGELVAGRPTEESGRAASAYLATVQAVQAAQRERVDVAQVLATPGHGQLLTASRWAPLENAALDAFRWYATRRLTAHLEGVLSGPAGMTVQRVREEFLRDPRDAVAHTSLGAWLDASGARIAGLLSVESGAARDLAASASRDISGAQADILRDLSLSLAVLMIVAALGLVLRRSITRPLREVSEGARTLSSGDLTLDVGYVGRDEIGEVAAAFRDLHVTAERLVGEIRATNTAISDSRLDHRADAGAFEGIWAQLLGGMNDTTEAFARLHRRRQQAEREQAALRRVATLVAKGVAPAEVFDAVVGQMHRLLGADNTRLLRYEADDTATVVAARSEPGVEIPQWTHHPLEGQSVTAKVWRSRDAARPDSFEGPPGSVTDELRRLGLSSAAGAPVLVQDRLWGVMIALWVKHQQDPGIEDRITHFTELVATAISNAQARADLAASRARIVTTSDETRRRIERDLHDGAQQRLVSLGLGLRAALESVPPDQAELRRELARVAEGVADVLEELRELSQGIHPAVLAMGGLGPALKTLARRSAVPVQLDIGTLARLPDPVEVAAYFVVSEALANAAKHARASMVKVRVEACDSLLKVSIRDDGIGGADPSRGSGLIGLTDRVEALGGTISVSSHPGTGTAILAELPIDDDLM
jgi:signal transduction histidine kinase